MENTENENSTASNFGELDNIFDRSSFDFDGLLGDKLLIFTYLNQEKKILNSDVPIEILPGKQQ